MKHQSIYNRLRRIEGQIRGIEEMVSKDRPETDILIQLEAVKSSVSSSISTLVEEMIKKNPDGKSELGDQEIRTILRLIRQ